MVALDFIDTQRGSTWIVLSPVGTWGFELGGAGSADMGDLVFKAFGSPRMVANGWTRLCLRPGFFRDICHLA